MQVYVCGDNGLFECSECIDSDIQNAFYQGAKWADKNPKASWIRYKDDLPPKGVEVVAYHHKWKDKDFNPNGTRVGFLNGDDEFISSYWWDYQDCYQTISKSICENNKDFYERHIDNTEPEYWHYIPKPPKE